MNIHLNEEQLYGMLETDVTPDDVAVEHLEWCAACRFEVEDLRHSLAAFRDAASGLAWTYTAPRHSARRTAKQLFLSLPRLAWAGGLVAAMGIGTAFLSLPHRSLHPVAPASETSTETAGIPSDEALLEGIDHDLSTSVPPSLEPLSTQAANEKTPSN